MASQDEDFKALENLKLGDLEIVAQKSEEGEEPSAFERMIYLCPSRYFRAYMVVAKRSNGRIINLTWIPEGYNV